MLCRNRSFPGTLGNNCQKLGSKRPIIQEFQHAQDQLLHAPWIHPKKSDRLSDDKSDCNHYILLFLQNYGRKVACQSFVHPDENNFFIKKKVISKIDIICRYISWQRKTDESFFEIRIVVWHEWFIWKSFQKEKFYWAGNTKMREKRLHLCQQINSIFLEFGTLNEKQFNDAIQIAIEVTI